MSLAFDKQGKPFAFARRAKKLLVRLFRNPGARGTCSQVLGADGQPLYVETDTDYMEFRRAVNHVPGLYRLDQCDDDGNELEDTQAAYVSIDLPRNGVNGDAGNGDISPLVIIQQMAATQADVMKAMAAQQAALMAATAEILRAPYRPAPVGALPELRNADASNDRDDEDDDDDNDEPAAPEHPATVALRMMEPYLPQFGAFLYEQFIKFMQGRKSATTPAAAPAQMPASVPVAAVPQPVPASAPVSAAAGTSSPSVTHAVPVEAAAIVTSAVPHAQPEVTAPTVAQPTSNSTAAATTTPPSPTSAPAMTAHDQLAHLYAIREQLSAKERAIAEHAIAHMDAATHTHWLAELSAMSVDEATEMIRTMIAQLPQPPR